MSNLITSNEKRQITTKKLSIQHTELEFSPLTTSNNLKLKKKLSAILIENSSFDIISKISEKKHKFDKAALSLEKGFNKSIQRDNLNIYSPKMTEECEEKIKIKFLQEDLRIYSNNFNFIYYKIPVKLYVNYPSSFETFGKKKIMYNMDSQTKLLSVK